MTDEPLDLLVHRADLDGLIRLIEERCTERDWDGLRRIRDRSRAAVGTGRQLWPAATLAEFRLALLAPPPWAAGVVDEQSGRFTIGPLSEVVAQQHTWDDLHPHLERGPRALYVAHERALRGDEPDPATLADLPPVLDIPVVPRAWEPGYALATYHEHGAEFPPPPLPTPDAPIDPIRDAERLDDDVDLALRQLVEPWTATSNGRAEAVCVSGGLSEAIGALGVQRCRVAPLSPGEALAWLAWAGASGGAHGRRRGAAAGRYGAWWLLAALGDALDSWPPDPDELGALAHELEWFRWDAHEPEMGWVLRLAVVDRAEDVAWAWAAQDAT